MKQWMVGMTVVVLLTLPLMAGADHMRSWDEGDMPSWWTPYPPMGGPGGMGPGRPQVTPREQIRATQPQAVPPAGQAGEKAREPEASSMSKGLTTQ